MAHIDWLGWLLEWFPTLLVIVIVVFFWRRALGKNDYANRHQREHVEEMKRQNELLERIASALEKIGSK